MTVFRLSARSFFNGGPALGSLACADDAVDADGQFNQCDRARAGKQVTDPPAPASPSPPLPSRVAAHLSVFLRFCSPGQWARFPRGS